jgi:protein-S-isoprenylcysteine O-methyltransferase Ste14
MHPQELAAGALIAFGLTEFFLRRGHTARRWKGTLDDRGSTVTVLVCYALVILVLVTVRVPGMALPRTAMWIGVATSFLGLIIRWWAMKVLGRFYTRALTIESDQIVVQRGPYRFIRHPGYLGSLLTWVGAAVAGGNLLVVGIVAVVLLIAYGRRIHVEEVMLRKHFGSAYLDYRKRSWRLLPPLY